MAEYIEKEAALQIIDYAKQLTSEQIVRESGTYELLSDTGKACYDGIIAALAMCKQLINECVRAADVQPVKWISVKDRLPESEKEVLVWYRYTWGAAPTSYGFGINRWYSNTKQWREGCLLKGVEVLYWQPLPEPPKDGDTNERS